MFIWFTEAFILQSVSPAGYVSFQSFRPSLVGLPFLCDGSNEKRPRPGVQWVQGHCTAEPSGGGLLRFRHLSGTGVSVLRTGGSGHWSWPPEDSLRNNYQDVINYNPHWSMLYVISYMFFCHATDTVVPGLRLFLLAFPRSDFCTNRGVSTSMLPNCHISKVAADVYKTSSADSLNTLQRKLRLLPNVVIIFKGLNHSWIKKSCLTYHHNEVYHQHCKYQSLPL